MLATCAVSAPTSAVAKVGASWARTLAAFARFPSRTSLERTIAVSRPAPSEWLRRRMTGTLLLAFGMAVLLVPELPVGEATLHQLLMGTDIHDLALFHHQDLVAIHEG